MDAERGANSFLNLICVNAASHYDSKGADSLLANGQSKSSYLKILDDWKQKSMLKLRRSITQFNLECLTLIHAYMPTRMDFYLNKETSRAQGQ
jgi:hypothetical protein